MNWTVRDGSTDQRIIDHVYTENGYEMPVDMTGKFVIDIGANIGTFSVLCAKRGARVVAYEPEPSNFEALCHHAAGQAIVCRQIALGDVDGTTQLWIHPENTGGHSTTDPSVGDQAISVQSLSIETILSTRRCDVLKLDCEGAEVYAFKALIEGLYERVPEIVCELHMERAEQLDLASKLAPFYEGTNIFQADWRFLRRTDLDQMRHDKEGRFPV